MTLTADHRTRIQIRLFALTAAVSSLAIVVLVIFTLNAKELADHLDGLGAAQLPVTTLAVAVLSSILVPAGLLAGAAGYVLGALLGWLAALVGLVLGAVLTAEVVRHVGTADAAEALGKRANRTARWLERRPFRTVMVGRLVPGIPFTGVSCLCGLTAIPRRTIAGATLVGFAPRAFAYSALGGSLQDLDRPEAQAAIAATALLVVSTLLLPKFFPTFDLNREPTL